MHDNLGATVRAWRERLMPAAAGLPAGGARRTPGLRREELAALAGISVDYLVRLEQGRAVSPSGQVLASLARALRLTPEERDHLYRQAGHAPPSRRTISAHITPGIQRMLDRLADVPVGVFDAAWTLITWNPAWAAVMGDQSAASGRDRNLLWRHFTTPTPESATPAPEGSDDARLGSRVLRDPEETAQFEQSAVADLRMAAGRYPDDAGLHRLITDLQRASARFAGLWSQHQVAARHTDRKTINHPEVGPMTLDCDVLTADGSDLRIVMYTADPTSDDASKLNLALALGHHLRPTPPPRWPHQPHWPHKLTSQTRAGRSHKQPSPDLPLKILFTVAAETISHDRCLVCCGHIFLGV
jgi:transcriptional regulator with XRE-family HTH domain